VVRVPADQDAKIREALESRFNITVAGGLGELRGKVLRIATMGITASPFYVLPTLEALEVLARELWSKSEKGSAVAEAARVFEKSA
jgi:aspartate aminotransferase-like enzyme